MSGGAQKFALDRTPAEIERLLEDLSWHYKEVQFLRDEMRRALNTLMRPPSLDWPGDEHPFMEASRILSEALSPARRHQGGTQ